MPDPPRAPAPPAPPPCCARHAGQPAAWYCRACQHALCLECVRVYSSREADFASCKTCGGRCDAIIHDSLTARDGRLTQAVREEKDRREARHRDFVLTPIVLGSAFLIHATTLTAAAGPWTGLLHALAWLIAGTAFASLAYLALDYFTGVGFDPIGSTIARLAAIITCVHAARAITLAVLAPSMPSATGGFVGSVGSAFHAVLIMSIALLIVPTLVLFPTVRLLLDVDGFEATTTITTLLAAACLTYILMTGYGFYG